jgi:hypothetical protein
MDENSIEPLNTGQQNRQVGRKRLIHIWLRRMRLVLMTVLWVAKAIWKVAQVIESIIDGS